MSSWLCPTVSVSLSSLCGTGSLSPWPFYWLHLCLCLCLAPSGSASASASASLTVACVRCARDESERLEQKELARVAVEHAALLEEREAVRCRTACLTSFSRLHCLSHLILSPSLSVSPHSLAFTLCLTSLSHPQYSPAHSLILSHPQCPLFHRILFSVLLLVIAPFKLAHLFSDSLSG